ncbi:glycosyltransferase family 2 protein [Segetibacter aerophilus]|uniref:Glycosyl transferase n=1 Tax=Segetibacter aerophilus TaxID=670293 RepID=A0A512BFP3_9BACT|nr:glycosyltransferase family 2 protein [Segetibacter aerophilus]GEO10788.1 glycosyl transferase [Segetibacter aerophilus]
MQLVSIITVNYNNAPVTEELLQSIFDKNRYSDIEIIVVDNGSKVDPVPAWIITYPTVKFIRSETNIGFAGGNNLGIKASTGGYLFLINNDTEVTDDLVGLLANTLDQNSNVGAISPAILFFDAPEVFQYAGFTKMNYLTGRNQTIGIDEKNMGQYNDVVGETAYAHGAAMMIRRTAIDKAGLMAENYFLYYEELDWSERIKQKGFDIWINTNAIIFHKESRSVGKNSALKEYYMNRNRILFIRSHAPAFTYCMFMIYFLSIVSTRNMITYLRNKQFSFISILFKAIYWNFTNSVNSKRLYFPS